MNLRKVCPDIPNNWKGGISDVCRILGEEGKPLSYKTIRKYINLTRAHGGIKYSIGINGRIQIKGAEVKRLWRIL